MTPDLAPIRLASVAPRASLAPLSPAVLPSLLPAVLCSVFALPLLTQPCEAKPAAKKVAAGQKVTQGVWGWTSGSQTYLRARPGAATPPVAKVPAHTKLFVWGKFNGWYRVETPDHTFGWVYHDYINANDTQRIAALSHSKAVEASNRTANQTMYGSPELLKRHYALYGASGAARGLAKEGVHLAQASKPKSTVRVAAKPIAKPSLVAQGSASKPVRVAVAPKTAIAPKSTPRVVSPRAAAPRIARAVIAPQDATLPRTKSSAQLAPASQRRAAPKLALNTDAPQHDAAAQAASQVETSAPVEKVAIPGEGMTASPSLSTPQIAVAPRLAMRPATQPPVTHETTTPTVTITDSTGSTIAPSAPPSIPVTSQAPRMVATSPQKGVPTKRVNTPTKSAVAIKPPVVAKAPAPAKAKPRLSRWQQRLQWRQQKAKIQAARVTKNRQDLRRRMGGPVMMTPPSSSPALAPISPAELLRAQQAWMASQGNQATPDAKGLPAPEKLLTPSTLEKDAAKEGGASGEGGTPIVPITPASLSYRGNATPGVVLVNKAASGTTINRGGSPRDYARYAPPATDALGNKLANQALGYRGMPYIYGASNPRRGFDCSGLIYFILRSRGYNPPRTAAGYARYGQAVPKDQLRSGDLLLFSNTYKRGISHIGIYMGDGKFVHAARPGEGVRVDSLSSAYYGRKFWGARRVPQK